MKSDLRRFGRGFVYAWNGIRAAVQEERNFRFHLCAAVYALAVVYLAELDLTGAAIIFLCIFAVMAMELMNSAVERAVDKPDTTHWWSAGAAKDMAAGAVLLTALGALCAGLCLLAPRLPLVLAKMAASPLTIALWVLSLVPAYLFIFRYHNQKQKGEQPNAEQDP